MESEVAKESPEVFEAEGSDCRSDCAAGAHSGTSAFGTSRDEASSGNQPGQPEHHPWCSRPDDDGARGYHVSVVDSVAAAGRNGESEPVIARNK